MHALGTAFLSLALTSAAVVASPAGATPARAIERHDRAITVVEVSRANSGAPMDLSERGHVVFTEASTGASDHRAVEWYRGETIELTPDEWEADTLPTAVNRRGQAVGARLDDGGGFVWSDGITTPLTGESGTVVSAIDIDDRGRILANERAVDTFTYRAMVLDGRRTVRSPLLPNGEPMLAIEMNNHRQVIGHSNGEPASFFWPVDQPPVELVAPAAYRSQALEINDRGTVLLVGMMDDGFDKLYLWRRGELTDLGLGGNLSFSFRLREQAADQLNERDEVAGTLWTASGETRAFLWSDGELRVLGTLGGEMSRANGINDRGEVVGESQTASGEVHAFLWRDGVMTDIGTMFENPDESYATAINNRGQIAGVRYFRTPDRRNERVVLWETRGRR